MVCEYCKSATVLDPESATELLEIANQVAEEEQNQPGYQMAGQTLQERQSEPQLARH